MTNVLAGLIDAGWRSLGTTRPNGSFSIAKYFVTGRLFCKSEQTSNTLSESRLVKLFLTLESQGKPLKKGQQEKKPPKKASVF